MASDSPRWQKAIALLRLARKLSASNTGVSLSEIMEEFEVSRKTAERMRDAVLDLYPDATEYEDEERHKRWCLPAGHPRAHDPFQVFEVTSIENAAAMMEQYGAADQARILRDVALKIRAALPSTTQRSFDTDHELLSLSERLIQRPGPRAGVAGGVIAALRDAIVGMRKVSFTYEARIKGDVTRRVVEPYGFIYGLRPYLLAWNPEGAVPGFRLFSLTDISELEICNAGFLRDEGFSLDAYVAQSFGAFQEPAHDIVWRVAPEAAEEARTWRFHPTQTLEDRPDGSLIVRFHAGGLREMCWHLFTWGGAIEVLEPLALKNMMSSMQFKGCLNG